MHYSYLAGGDDVTIYRSSYKHLWLHFHFCKSSITIKFSKMVDNHALTFSYKSYRPHHLQVKWKSSMALSSLLQNLKNIFTVFTDNFSLIMPCFTLECLNFAKFKFKHDSTLTLIWVGFLGVRFEGGGGSEINRCPPAPRPGPRPPPRPSPRPLF